MMAMPRQPGFTRADIDKARKQVGSVGKDQGFIGQLRDTILRLCGAWEDENDHLCRAVESSMTDSIISAGRSSRQ